jgi:PII-like signaling protein
MLALSYVVEVIDEYHPIERVLTKMNSFQTQDMN